MHLIHSVVSDNSADHGGGIFCGGLTEELTLTHSTISGNTANVNGGGIAVVQNEFAGFGHSIFSANTAPIGPDCEGILRSFGFSEDEIATRGNDLRTLKLA